MKEAVNIDRSSKYIYSDKIKSRRRSLFPCENSELVDKFSTNSDLDLVNPLCTSDLASEYNYVVPNDISLIASTNLVCDILSTPTNKNYPPSEQSMSPLYLSPYGNIQIGKSIVAEVSPSKHLKTPNDSNTHCGMLPKLSRRCSKDHIIHQVDSQEPSLLSTHPKCSKVRTTLFPEIDTISFAPKQFYPKVDFHKPVSGKKAISLRTDITMSQNVKKRSEIKNMKGVLGQINCGVRHNIKKPKKRKLHLQPKISANLLAKIKTFKNDKLANSEFKGFLKELAELNESKKVQLIRHSSCRDQLKFPEKNSTAMLKRSYDSCEDIVSKKQKLSSNGRLNTEFPEHSSELEVSENLELGCPQNINEILVLLDDSIGQDKENTSKKKSNSSIVERCFSDTLLSPTSEMCNMASVMKIESPKKATNLNILFQNMKDNRDIQKAEEIRQNEVKTDHLQYFPIFCKNSKLTNKPDRNFPKPEISVKKKKTNISSNQMLLDAGQKRFGLTECSHCNYVYQAGDPNDETMHENHHSATRILQFSGWKNEHVVETLSDGGRIIQVLPTDSKVWTEKVKKIVEFINRDMGYYDMTLDINTSKVFLFIVNRTVIGCLVAERKTRGFKFLSSDDEIDLCSTEEYPIQCGVSRIWVAPRYRKNRVATKLMDILKSHFMNGIVLTNCDIALSSPTTDGKLFAAKYFQTQHFFTYFD